MAESKTEVSLKDQGNEFFKAGNYLKAAAVYTQAIKKDPSNATLYSNRAAAFLNLVKLQKALSDAETTISLNPSWDKGYFRKGCVLEAMERYDDALDAFKIASQHNPQSTEVSRKIKRLTQLSKDKKRSAEVDNMRSNVDLAKHLDGFKSELGYFRKGCVLEAMERYDDALDAFKIASQHNPQSTEVSRKIKRLTQLSKDKKRSAEVDNMRSNVDLAKHLDGFKSELAQKHVNEEHWKDVFSFVVETMETAVRSWHQTSTVDARVHFLLDKEKTDTDKYAPVVNVDKAFESPHTHGDCVSFLRQYAVDSFSRAACLVVPKNSISYPQVWKGLGPRKWKHGQSDGFFVEFESPLLRKEWFIPSSSEKGQILCRDPVALDISAHEVIPRIFKDT